MLLALLLLVFLLLFLTWRCRPGRCLRLPAAVVIQPEQLQRIRWRRQCGPKLHDRLLCLCLCLCLLPLLLPLPLLLYVRRLLWLLRLLGLLLPLRLLLGAGCGIDLSYVRRISLPQPAVEGVQRVCGFEEAKAGVPPLPHPQQHLQLGPAAPHKLRGLAHHLQAGRRAGGQPTVSASRYGGAKCRPKL